MSKNSVLSIALFFVVAIQGIASSIDDFHGKYVRIENADPILRFDIGVDDLDPHVGAPILLCHQYYQFPNQHWKFVPLGGDEYQLIAEHSGMALGRTTSFGDLSQLSQQLPDSDDLDQIWKISQNDEGAFQILSVDESFALEMIDWTESEKGWGTYLSARVVLAERDSSLSAQYWTVTDERLVNMPTVALQNVETGLFVTGTDWRTPALASAQANYLEQTIQIVGDFSHAALRFYFGDGKALYVNNEETPSHDPRYIESEITNGVFSSGFIIDHATIGHYWAFEKQDDDTYLIKSAGSELYITVSSQVDEFNHLIVQEQRNPTLPQKWRIVDLDLTARSFPKRVVLPRGTEGDDSSNSVKIEAENFDLGAGYSDVDPVNHGRAYRDTKVDIRQDPHDPSNHIVGWIENSEVLSYTLYDARESNYDLTLRIASSHAGSKLHIAIKHGMPDYMKRYRAYATSHTPIVFPETSTVRYVLDVPNTGSTDSFVDVTIPNVYIGGDKNHKFILQAEGGGFDIDWFEFKPVGGNK